MDSPRTEDFSPVLEQALAQVEAAGFAAAAQRTRATWQAAYTTSSERLGAAGEAIVQLLRECGSGVPPDARRKLAHCLAEIGKVWPQYRDRAGGRSVAQQLAGLAACFALVFAAGGIGAAASISAPSFYAQLVRPGWAPPAGVFGPTWSALYTLMAVAAWLVWREPAGPRRTAGLRWFVAQLGLNALWSWLFFGWRLGAPAFADVLLLLVLIAVTLANFWRVRPLAGALLVPYLAWVSFAAALTWAVWRANPALL